MNVEDYDEPVARLLTYEESVDSMPNYVEELGLRTEHIPALIRMATDSNFNELSSDRPEVWAPLHAWRALGQLKAEAAIEPLMGLFATEDEWVPEEMPEVFGQIGPVAIPPLAVYLANSTQDVWARIIAADCLREIAIAYPENRDEAISPLMHHMAEYANNDPNLNSTLIHNLTLLKVIEAAPLMEQAFATDQIDEFLTGSWARVQVELGIKQEKDFSAEELKPKVPPQIANIRKMLESIEFHQGQPQARQPHGFGGASSSDSKKKKKKKKK